MSFSSSLNATHIEGYIGECTDIFANIIFDGVVSRFMAELANYVATPAGVSIKVAESKNILELLVGSRYTRELPVC